MDIEKIMKIARERVFQNFIMSFSEFGVLQVIDWNTISGLFLTMKGKR